MTAAFDVTGKGFGLGDVEHQRYGCSAIVLLEARSVFNGARKRTVAEGMITHGDD